MTEDEMIGWYHQLNGHRFEQTLRDNEGQGILVCCSPWSCKESNNSNLAVDWWEPEEGGKELETH